MEPHILHSPTFELAPWQKNFVDAYLSAAKPRSLLVAEPGTGKTHTALHVAQRMVESGAADAILIISDSRVVQNQWRSVAGKYSIELATTTEELAARKIGAALTIKGLLNPQRHKSLSQMAKRRKWFVVVDDVHRSTTAMFQLLDSFLGANTSSRALFIRGTAPRNISSRSRLRFDAEFFFDRSLIEVPDNRIHIAQFSPSFAILRRLQNENIRLDDLGWREFEKLIAELLESDGYTVKQMNGSKDGGVDVIATREMPAIGSFKTLWQAKKQKSGNKVGISIVRELADTRREFGANKAMIVTSSYLTSGALARIQRDNYLLGKVDRDELDVWIQRKLMAK